MASSDYYNQDADVVKTQGVQFGTVLQIIITAVVIGLAIGWQLAMRFGVVRHTVLQWDDRDDDEKPSRTIAVQSQTTYKRNWQKPEFRPLPEAAHGATVD